MSTTTAKGSGSTKNDGGTVLGVDSASVASDSPVSSGIGLDGIKTGSEYGSKVVANAATGDRFTDPQGVTTAKSAGTGGLAYFPTKDERNFLIKGAGATGAGKINNDASTLLTIPGAEYDGVGRDGLHGTIGDRHIGSGTLNSFNVLATPGSGVVPGRTIGSNEGDPNTFINPDDATDAVASEIFPTRGVPGELTYHFGGQAKPTTDEYKARDAYEDETDTSS